MQCPTVRFFVAGLSMGQIACRHGRFRTLSRGILFALVGIAIMRKLTWIGSLLLCAGCVVSQPSQKDNAAPLGQPVESVKNTVSEKAVPAPILRPKAATSTSVTRPNPQPEQTAAQILPASSTEKTRAAKADEVPAPAASTKTQTSAASTSIVLATDEDVPANIIIKGAPKEAEPESYDKSLGDKLRQKGVVWAAGGIAVAMCGWVFVKRSAKPRRGTKGKNSKGKGEAKDDMEKAWKQGGVF